MVTNIQQLAADVLNHVTTSTKTAAAVAATPYDSFNTEIGQHLSKAAGILRELDDVTPGNADLAVLLSATKTASTKETPALPVVNASARGDYFRKLAEDIRTQGARNADDRVVKVAKMINAAVGLHHLGGK